MQRTEDGQVVISCDFCGTDWDQLLPMIEGHRGSVICLVCLKLALEQAARADETFSCSLCRREGLGVEVPRWFGTSPLAGGGPAAVACMDCLCQAAAAFSRDPDVDWTGPRQGADGG